MKEIIIEENGRKRVQTINTEPSRTDQSWKDMCDVNLIVAKYKKTGEWFHLARKQGVYADVSEISDYNVSLQKVLNAQNAFNALPSELRNRFGNDPAKLLEFIQDPKNYDEGVKLGLFVKNDDVMTKNETQNDQKQHDVKTNETQKSSTNPSDS